MTYTAVWWRRAGEVGSVVVFTCLLAATIALTPPNNPNIFWLASLWLIMLLASLYVFLFAIFEVKIESDSLSLRSLVVQKTLTRSDVKQIEITVTSSSSQVTIGDQNGRDRTILLKSFADPTALAGNLNQWWDRDQNPDADRQQTFTFRARSFACLATFVGAFMTIPFLVLPLLDERVRPMLPVSGPFALLLLALFTSAFRFYIIISPEGLVVRQMGGLKRVPWESITSVRLGNQSSKGSVRETITIKWTGKTVYLGEVFDHYPRIRDLILLHVPSETVTDDRRSL